MYGVNDDFFLCEQKLDCRLNNAVSVSKLVVNLSKREKKTEN